MSSKVLVLIIATIAITKGYVQDQEPILRIPYADLVKSNPQWLEQVKDELNLALNTLPYTRQLR